MQTRIIYNTIISRKSGDFSHAAGDRRRRESPTGDWN